MKQRVLTTALTAIATVLVFATGHGAFAQMDKLKNTTPQERAGMQTDMMTSKLALTPDQTSKVSAINLKYAQQMDPIIKSSERPLVKMRQMKPIDEAKEAELKGVFTPDQYQKYLAAKAEMREKLEEKALKK
jgi:Spy/CpxP family protein refolding chaperone